MNFIINFIYGLLAVGSSSIFFKKKPERESLYFRLFVSDHEGIKSQHEQTTTINVYTCFWITSHHVKVKYVYVSRYLYAKFVDSR
jgi:hypothetical protein